MPCEQFFLFSTVSLPHQRPSTWNVEKAQIDGWMNVVVLWIVSFTWRNSNLFFWSNGFTSSDEFYGDIQGYLLCLSWVAAGQLYQATWWIFPNWPSLRNSRLVRYWNRTHTWMSVSMYRYIVVVIYMHICLGVYFVRCLFFPLVFVHLWGLEHFVLHETNSQAVSAVCLKFVKHVFKHSNYHPQPQHCCNMTACWVPPTTFVVQVFALSPRSGRSMW